MPGTEIDIRADLLGRHRYALETLAQMSLRVSSGRWVLVGGLMVMVLGREHRARSPRAEGTKDADIVVDVLSHPSILTDVAHFLQTEYGYTLADQIGSTGDAARCTFASHSAQIDVLCPDGTAAEALDIGGGVRSLAIPGGRRALETGRQVELYFSDDYPNAEIRVPTLPGAIIVKAAAGVDPRTAGSPRHIQTARRLVFKAMGFGGSSANT